VAERKNPTFWSVFNVPYGGGYGPLNLATPRGARRAPRALQKEFNRQNIFIADNGVSYWQNVLWEDICLWLWQQNCVDAWDDMEEEISDRVSYFYSRFDKFDVKTLFLGGSHSITAATYSAIANTYERRNTGLILLDAHPDCCNKADWPIHSDWLRWLIRGARVSPENILIIGLRQIERAEKDFLDSKGINYYLMDSVKPGVYEFSTNINTFMINDRSMALALEKLRRLNAIYLSIDIDVASGVFAPGTGCPSPGGFTDTELINFVKKLKVALPNIVAADIVEINPLKWWQRLILPYDATVDLGVKLIKEIIS